MDIKTERGRNIKGSSLSSLYLIVNWCGAWRSFRPSGYFCDFRGSEVNLRTADHDLKMTSHHLMRHNARKIKKYGSCFSAYIYYVQIFFLSKLYYFGSADFTTKCLSQSDKRPSVHIPAFSPTVQAVLCKLFSFWQGVSNVLCEYYGYDLPLFWKDFLSNHSFCTSFKTHKWP